MIRHKFKETKTYAHRRRVISDALTETAAVIPPPVTGNSPATIVLIQEPLNINSFVLALRWRAGRPLVTAAEAFYMVVEVDDPVLFTRRRARQAYNLPPEDQCELRDDPGCPVVDDRRHRRVDYRRVNEDLTKWWSNEVMIY